MLCRFDLLARAKSERLGPGSSTKVAGLLVMDRRSCELLIPVMVLESVITDVVEALVLLLGLK